MADPIQSLCEEGQRALLATDYLSAERHLAAAETLAWRAKDYDALARLYMPLQEAHRQRRQQSADGPFVTRFDSDIDQSILVGDHTRGQFIIAEPATIVPSVLLRIRAKQQQCYFDVPLAAGYTVEGQQFFLIVPWAGTELPAAAAVTTVDEITCAMPEGSVLIPADAVPPDREQGDAETFGFIMSVWERLHTPVLATADAMTDDVEKLAAYRDAIRIDYACEFAHQRASDAARRLSRKK